MTLVNHPPSLPSRSVGLISGEGIAPLTRLQLNKAHTKQVFKSLIYLQWSLLVDIDCVHGSGLCNG